MVPQSRTCSAAHALIVNNAGFCPVRRNLRCAGSMIKLVHDPVEKRNIRNAELSCFNVFANLLYSFTPNPHPLRYKDSSPASTRYRRTKSRAANRPPSTCSLHRISPCPPISFVRASDSPRQSASSSPYREVCSSGPIGSLHRARDS